MSDRSAPNLQADEAWRSRIDIIDTHSFGEDRLVASIVSPRDGLVVARVIAILAASLVALAYQDGATSIRIAALLAGFAVLQPLLAVFWPQSDRFRQAQIFADLGICVAFVVLAPEYYWLTAIIVSSLIANYAVIASLRFYVPAAVVAVAGVTVFGWIQDVEYWWRATGTIGVLACGFGYMGYRTRIVTVSARRDLLSALTGVGGLAYLVDLSSDRSMVDVVGDVEQVVGWTRDEWMAADHRSLVHPDDVDDYWITADVAIGQVIDRTGRIRTSDGDWIWMRDMSRVVSHGGKPYLRGFAIDVTAQQVGLNKVTDEAATDALTGLRNRRWLMAEMEARSERGGYHLVLIDLDGFKNVNDTFGHDAGDALLEVVAGRLAASLRPGDALARLGGDEFAILMDDMPDTESVREAVARFAWEVAQPVEIHGVTITTSLSAGVAYAVAGQCDGSTMLRHADIAMYTAKRRRTGVAVFDAGLARSSDRRSALSTSLSVALQTTQLRLHYQPIIDVTTGEMVGAEGLARWQHPEFGLLLPSQFLDVILMSHRAGEFTRAMVTDAIRTAAALDAGGHAVPVSVNMPVRAVEDQDFEAWFVGECARHGMAPHRLVFEIAERDIHDTATITRAIDRLVELGVTISVDDFGAGHATFERLRWRNVAQLKLDSDVLRNATSDPRERAILHSVINLADELGYHVVAEGVEREDQLELLRTFGCAYVQGFLFAGALPVEELLDRLADGRLVAARGASPMADTP